MKPDNELFVDSNSIVRTIWGKSDIILFIFAGAAAEFALNKAVDWLYVTKRLPNDPLGRLFSTVTYARQIVFSTTTDALRAIESIRIMHHHVEGKRGTSIPDWAYRDVLFMLTDYSIRAYEVVERKLTTKEKEEVFHAFNRLGLAMNITGLPESYDAWLQMRHEHLHDHLIRSSLTDDLFLQYRKHLGIIRYSLLLEVQKLVVPKHVQKLLSLSSYRYLRPAILLYKFSKRLHVDARIRTLLVPHQYKEKIRAMDTPSHRTHNNEHLILNHV